MIEDSQTIGSLNCVLLYPKTKKICTFSLTTHFRKIFGKVFTKILAKSSLNLFYFVYLNC